MSTPSSVNESAPAIAKKPSIVPKILLLILVVLGGLVAYVAAQPDEFKIERSQTMTASAKTVFAHVNDFHKWQAWSPWAKLDPNAKNTFEGPESGKDAVFKWSGNNQVGEGAMTIVESHPFFQVRMRLDFEKPMKDTSTTLFHLEEVEGQTKVTWTMLGKHPNLMAKGMCLMMNMDKMVGDKFVEGLANLKIVVEQEQRAALPAETGVPAPGGEASGEQGEGRSEP